MQHPAPLYALAGLWSGTNKLWFTPDSPVIESASTAQIEPLAAGKFLSLRYTWTYEDVPQEGMLLIGCCTADESATIVFVDSFHMDEGVMVCQGTHTHAGTVDARGSYSVEGGPEWGWRISIEPASNDAFRLAMYNIMPDGTEMLAVEVHYTRT